jgi:hypothetical protein
LQLPKMDSSRVLSLLEQLDDEIDDLEESLAPLLKTALSESAAKLPLLDKAKLYVLVTYAIESMLFCRSGPSRLNTVANRFASLSSIKWGQGTRAPGLQGTHKSEAIL